MRILQHLYENGYITYMRTDSQQYSAEFISSVKKAITDKHGAKFVNAEFATNADDKCAHEAIRPTNIALEELSDLIDAKERKVYNIVWTTTMQSLMADSTSMKITAKIELIDKSFFTYDSEAVEFIGWKIVSGDTFDDKAYQLLQTIRSIDKYNKIAALCVYSRL